MAVTVRQRKLPNGGMHWQCDIRVRLPNGLIHSERVRAPGKTRSAALRWARSREAFIIRHGPQKEERPEKQEKQQEAKQIPTLEEFAPRFIRDHVVANRRKPATRMGWEDAFRLYLIPHFGGRPLDRIGQLDVQKFKRAPLAAQTVNMVLSKLKALLRAARSWEIIETIPEIKLVKVPATEIEFYDFDEYERLVTAARQRCSWDLAVVLLGGDAGLRAGEILGLRPRDVDLERGSLTVVENVYRGEVGDPKGGRTRTIPLTRSLRAALSELPRGGERVLDREGRKLYARLLDYAMYRAQRSADLPKRGPHVLRHTFCSHLAMKGAPIRTIQQLAGHANASTTERYMHLAPRVLGTAIDLLDR